MGFSDKVVLVTGGSSGIGAAIAAQFSLEGAKVAIVGRNETKLNNVSKICANNGSTPLIIVADISNDEDVKKIIDTTLSKFGKLDVLVNNAGIVRSTSILADNVLQTYDETIKTNLRSAVYLTNLAAPHLIETKGNIINISSVASTSILSPRNAAYCASKAALDHFTKCIALELAPKGVRVNSVNPGPVNTDIIDNMGVSEAYKAKVLEVFVKATATGRISEPEEIAEIVLFLASDKALSTTGASYPIDNGSLLKGTWNPQ